MYIYMSIHICVYDSADSTEHVECTEPVEKLADTCYVPRLQQTLASLPRWTLFIKAN